MPESQSDRDVSEQLAPLAVLRDAPASLAVAPNLEPHGKSAPPFLDRYVMKRGPLRLTLESSSVCNLRCVMCPQGRGLVNRPKHFEATLFENLLPALADVERVQLHGIGEPLHSPAFWRALETFNSHPNIFITVNSNMTVITDDQINTILNSQLSEINISLDAATPQTYAKIRGHDFHRVIANIKRLIAARTSRARNKPAILLNMTLMRENIEELEAFIHMAHELGAQGVCFWQLNSGQDYRIARDGWVFDYQQQMLKNHAQLSNRKILAAIALGQRLGMPIELDQSRDLFFQEAP